MSRFVCIAQAKMRRLLTFDRLWRSVTTIAIYFAVYATGKLSWSNSFVVVFCVKNSIISAFITISYANWWWHFACHLKWLLLSMVCAIAHHVRSTNYCFRHEHLTMSKCLFTAHRAHTPNSSDCESQYQFTVARQMLSNCSDNNSLIQTIFFFVWFEIGFLIFFPPCYGFNSTNSSGNLSTPNNMTRFIISKLNF